MSFYQIFNYKKIPSIKRIDLPPERRVNRNLEGIIIGEIVAIKKHPNADIVRIARVAIRKNKYITIIFGGPRIEYIGARVAVALPGTPTDDGKLKKRRYRGKVSHGMICAAVELALAARGLDAIMLFPDTLAAGTELRTIKKSILRKWLHEQKKILSLFTKSRRG